ncbi:uncharacterized protein LOC126858990 [Cataglyphis hispanica]|uniref:uncharacterized protein LOC126858990 n=1 Tax=Cataglyphis hispanica TaxID=1086592 RepID=UPI00218070B4|nr:uncharacterized protein LOC126858990 [Cataglyphis hispanica]
MRDQFERTSDSVSRRRHWQGLSTTCILTKLPTEDVVCRSSRNVSDKLDLGSASIGEEFLDTLEILQPRRTLTTCLTSLWTPTPGSIIVCNYDARAIFESVKRDSQ